MYVCSTYVCKFIYESRYNCGRLLRIIQHSNGGIGPSELWFESQRAPTEISEADRSPLSRTSIGPWKLQIQISEFCVLIKHTFFWLKNLLSNALSIDTQTAPKTSVKFME